ncbi:hypothetical protein [Maritimibacter sp. 55A14]|uniref:hypothetical protein n=1 Tax=Maritimibacter sp. 55A14 TaxID=2174844 RepID=UPI0011B271CA|nr:hypothetical protein [Maritimibacter sp. 55A14]
MTISLEEFKDAFERHKQVFLSLERNDQERGRIVFLSVHLETLLGTILLAVAKEKTVMEEVLARSGASFNARIDLCFALGLLDANERRDLTLFRKIRNKLAHSFEVKPNDQQISSWAKELSVQEITDADIKAQPAMAQIKEFFENANTLQRIEICLSALSNKLTVRIDHAQDIGRGISRAKLP